MQNLASGQRRALAVRGVAGEFGSRKPDTVIRLGVEGLWVAPEDALDIFRRFPGVCGGYYKYDHQNSSQAV